MKTYLFSFVLAAGVAFAQYKMEPAGAPPSELAPAFASTLDASGSKILAKDGSIFCEVWFRKTAPSGPKSTEENVVLPTIPQGALLGVIRFPGQGADRRGQTMKPGIYTLRYSTYPVDGAHQGVAPQRDFALMVPAAEDKDPESKPNYDELINMSRKASGTPHPAVLSLTTPMDNAKIPSFDKEGENDWTLNVKIGDLPVAIILVGKVES